MQQIKIFKSIESEMEQMETDMNKWMVRLQKKGGRIISINGNIAPQSNSSSSAPMSSFAGSDVLVIILFEIPVE